MPTKELAKFFCGFSANQVLTHGALALSGARFEVFGISYDPTLNTTAVMAWAVIALLLYYYAWGRRRRSATP